MTRDPGIAPADAAQHCRWPVWHRVLAYAVLLAIAVASIYFVDLKVHRAAVIPPPPEPASGR